MTKAEIRKLQMMLGGQNLKAALASLLAEQAKRSPVKPMKKERLAKKKSARELRNEETARIREACMKRCGGVCECGCERTFITNPISTYRAEMDHWLGGTGRRRQRQSIENCWMLTALCHRLRQNAQPSAVYWNVVFRQHCERYGYKFTPHIEHAQLKKANR